jgi:hypothetical protein
MRSYSRIVLANLPLFGPVMLQFPYGNEVLLKRERNMEELLKQIEVAVP